MPDISISQWAEMTPKERERTGLTSPEQLIDDITEPTESEAIAAGGDITEEQADAAIAAYDARVSARKAERDWYAFVGESEQVAIEASRLHGTTVQQELGYLAGDRVRRLKSEGKTAEAEALTAAYRFGDERATQEADKPKQPVSQRVMDIPGSPSGTAAYNRARGR